MSTASHPEVWLRGPVPAIPPELTPVARALLQAGEDLDGLASDLTPTELRFEPGGAASAGFHPEHLAGALDRLFTCARGESLSDEQLAAMKREGQPGDPPRPVDTLLAAVHASIDRAIDRLKATPVGSLQDVRFVGRSRLPCAMVKCAWLLFLLLVFLQPAFAQTRIRVEFTPDDECAVSTSGAGGRANLRYQRRTTELRCAVPSLSQASSGGEVELEVVLPPGHARPVDAFPRLEWTERDGRWQGTGRLDGVPAFVRIAPDWGFHRFRARVLDAAVILAVGLAIVWSVARGRAS